MINTANVLRSKLKYSKLLMSMLVLIIMWNLKSLAEFVKYKNMEETETKIFRY